MGSKKQAIYVYIGRYKLYIASSSSAWCKHTCTVPIGSLLYQVWFHFLLNTNGGSQQCVDLLEFFHLLFSLSDPPVVSLSPLLSYLHA